MYESTSSWGSSKFNFSLLGRFDELATLFFCFFLFFAPHMPQEKSRSPTHQGKRGALDRLIGSDSEEIEELERQILWESGQYILSVGHRRQKCMEIPNYSEHYTSWFGPAINLRACFWFLNFLWVFAGCLAVVATVANIVMVLIYWYFKARILSYSRCFLVFRLISRKHWRNRMLLANASAPSSCGINSIIVYYRKRPWFFIQCYLRSFWK